MKPIPTPAVMWEYLQALNVIAERTHAILRKLHGEEAYEEACKAVEEDEKNAKLIAQNQDPRVEVLSQKVDALTQALPNMAKAMAAEMAKAFGPMIAQAQVNKPARVNVPQMNIENPNPPMVDASHEPLEPEGDYLDELARERRERQQETPAPGPVLPNTTKKKTLRHDAINRAVAPKPSAGGEGE